MSPMVRKQVYVLARRVDRCGRGTEDRSVHEIARHQTAERSRRPDVDTRGAPRGSSGAMDEILIDTNILVYAHQPAEVRKHAAAVRVVEALIDGGAGGRGTQGLGACVG